MSDYYQILGVPKDAKPEQIKQAYRDLAFKYHPDRNKDNPIAVDKMKHINEAYAVLSDDNKRNEYDGIRQQFGSSARRQFRQQYSEQDIFRGSDIYRVLDEMAKSFGLRGYDDIFREFYGKGYQTFHVKRPGFFVSGFIFSGFLGRNLGPKGRLPFNRGPISYLTRHVIKMITGAAPQQRGRDLNDVIHIDEATAQKGGPYAYYHSQQSKKLVVNVPAGVKDGQKIRLSGMGSMDSSGHAPGDLYLKIRVKRPFLKRVKRLIG